MVHPDSSTTEKITFLVSREFLVSCSTGKIRYSSPSFSQSFSVFLNIICNLGKQNLASMNKIIILAGGGG